MKIKMILSVITLFQFFSLFFLPSCSKEMEIPKEDINNITDTSNVTTSVVYKEYVVEMKDGQTWRVTDPNSPQSGAQEFLPNPELRFNLDNLNGATKAVAIFDVWGGHTGTTGKKVRFNYKDWINMPMYTESLSNPECYQNEYNVELEIPVNYLRGGENIFEGTSGGQTCYSFNWGQWGWYSLILKVYYAKVVDTTFQLNIQKNGTIGENPDISIALNNPEEVEKVIFQGIYEGPDEDGDGKYFDLHGMYHYSELKGIIGVVEQEPFQVTWNTDWIPDQTNDIKLIAVVKLKNGFCFQTDAVTGIKFNRNSSSVKMYHAENVTEKFWVRNKKSAGCNFSIPESQSLGNAIEAKMFIRTWNGNNNEENGTPFKINDGDWLKAGGANHNFDFRMIDIPVEQLKNGLNTITFSSSTVEHGCEILWPGPSILVKYQN